VILSRAHVLHVCVCSSYNEIYQRRKKNVWFFSLSLFQCSLYFRMHRVVLFLWEISWCPIKYGQENDRDFLFFCLFSSPYDNRRLHLFVLLSRPVWIKKKARETNWDRFVVFRATWAHTINEYILRGSIVTSIIYLSPPSSHHICIYSLCRRREKERPHHHHQATNSSMWLLLSNTHGSKRQ
jgi:hypothetical protein